MIEKGDLLFIGTNVATVMGIYDHMHYGYFYLTKPIAVGVKMVSDTQIEYRAKSIEDLYILPNTIEIVPKNIHDERYQMYVKTTTGVEIVTKVPLTVH